MKEAVVCDSTCLIGLERIGELGILPALFEPIMIPPEVARVLMRIRGRNFSTVAELSQFSAREGGRQHKAPCEAKQARGGAQERCFQPVKRATAAGWVTAAARLRGLASQGAAMPRVPLRSTRGFMLPPSLRAKNVIFNS